MLMRWNYPFDTNSQIAIHLLWDLGPDPKATENSDSYLAPKGAGACRERILKQSLPLIHSLGLRSGLKQRNFKWFFPLSLQICSNP